MIICFIQFIYFDTRSFYNFYFIIYFISKILQSYFTLFSMNFYLFLKTHRFSRINLILVLIFIGYPQFFKIFLRQYGGFFPTSTR